MFKPRVVKEHVRPGECCGEALVVLHSQEEEEEDPQHAGLKKRAGRAWPDKAEPETNCTNPLPPRFFCALFVSRRADTSQPRTCASASFATSSTGHCKADSGQVARLPTRAT